MAVTVSPATSQVPSPPLNIINNTGAQIEAGSVVALSGWSSASALPRVILADKGVAGARAMAVVVTAIANGAQGTVYPCDQTVTGVNTTGSSVGDAVFLGTSGGYVFTTAPSTGRVERIGTVVSVGVSGSIYLWPAALQASD